MVSSVEPPVPHSYSLNFANQSEGSCPGRGWTVWLTSVFIRHNWQLIFANLSSIGTTHVAFTSVRKATSPYTYRVDSVEYWYHYIHSIEAIWAQMRFSTTFIGTDNMTKESLLHRHSSVHSKLIDWRGQPKQVENFAWVLGMSNLFYRLWCSGALFESHQESDTPSLHLLLNSLGRGWFSCWWKIFITAVLLVLLGSETWAWLV